MGFINAVNHVIRSVRLSQFHSSISLSSRDCRLNFGSIDVHFCKPMSLIAALRDFINTSPHLTLAQSQSSSASHRAVATALSTLSSTAASSAAADAKTESSKAPETAADSKMESLADSTASAASTSTSTAASSNTVGGVCYDSEGDSGSKPCARSEIPEQATSRMSAADKHRFVLGLAHRVMYQVRAFKLSGAEVLP